MSRVNPDVINSISENKIDISSSWAWIDVFAYSPRYTEIFSQPISLESTTLDFLRLKEPICTITIRETPDPNSKLLWTGISYNIDDDGNGGVQADTINYSTGVVGNIAPSAVYGVGTITISDTYVNLCSDNYFETPIKTYWVNGGTFTLTDGAEQYLVIDYNNGTPIYRIENNKLLVNKSSIILVRICWRQGNNVHSIDSDCQGLGLSNKIETSIINTTPYRKSTDGGLILSETLTPIPKTVLITGAVVYAASTPHPISAFNSSTNQFTFVRHVAGVWTYSDVVVYNNSQYDNGTDLVTLTTNKYTINWIYRSIGSSIQSFFVLGNNEYSTVAHAQAATAINVPLLLRDHCMLVGRIIVQKGATSGVVENVADTTFTGATVTETTNHNDLAGLQGNGPEYYHFTGAQYTDLTDGLDSSLHYHSSDRNRANHTGTQLAATISDFGSAADARITLQKGAANGIAPLNASAKINTTYLPDSILGAMVYQGVWNAATNTPTLPTPTSANKGFYWITSVSGTYNTMDFQVGDWAVSNGTGAISRIDNSDAISSWNGRSGAILPIAGDYSAFYVSLTGSYSNPSWITALDPAKITQTSNYRFVTDTEKTTWNGKQAAGNYVTTDTVQTISYSKTFTSETFLTMFDAVQALTVKIYGDSFFRYSVRADGATYWGSGAASWDTDLYRSAVGTLKTDGAFIVAGAITEGGTLLSTKYQAKITTGTTAQYFRGDLSLATFPTTWAGTAITGLIPDANISSAATWNSKQAGSSVLTSIAALTTGSGFLKLNAGVASLDTNAYLTSAGTINNVLVTQNNTSNTLYPLVWDNGSNQLFHTAEKFKINPNTGWAYFPVVAVTSSFRADSNTAKNDTVCAGAYYGVSDNTTYAHFWQMLANGNLALFSTTNNGTSYIKPLTVDPSTGDIYTKRWVYSKAGGNTVPSFIGDWNSAYTWGICGGNGTLNDNTIAFRTLDANYTPNGYANIAAGKGAFNGAAMPAWGTGLNPIMLGGEAFLYSHRVAAGTQPTWGSNFYYDGTDLKTIATYSNSNYPRALLIDTAGTLNYLASNVSPTAGATITDLNSKFSVDRSGNGYFAGSVTAGKAYMGTYYNDANGAFFGLAGSNAGTWSGLLFAYGRAYITSPNDIYFSTNTVGKIARFDLPIVGATATLSDSLISPFVRWRTNTAAPTSYGAAYGTGVVTPANNNYSISIAADGTNTGLNGTTQSYLAVNGTTKLVCKSGGIVASSTIVPDTMATIDLGSSSYRFASVHANNLITQWAYADNETTLFNANFASIVTVNSVSTRTIPNGTVAGQVKYVANRTGGAINVNGSSVAAGSTATFYWSGSAWL